MLDPEAEAVLRGRNVKPMPAEEAAWLRDFRAQLSAPAGQQGLRPPMDVIATTCPGPAGPVPLRLYRPDPRAHAPTVLFCHGGSFVGGTLDAYDTPLRHLARRAEWLVVAVDYRLAPEHPYPAALEDCRAALRFLSHGPAGADPGRLAIAGDGVGGLLATVLAREASVPLRLQVLLYPNTDLREGSAHTSRAEHDGVAISVDEMYRCFRLALRGLDRTRPDVSPLLTPDLRGLCPALVITNEHDPLRDEAEAYATRLVEAGVPMTLERLPGSIHGVLQLGGVMSVGDRLITRVADALRRAV